MERYHVLVKGRVQGVGFRYFVYYTARNTDITGWVRNLEDGSVEMEIQGKKENITLFLERIERGNGFSLIEDISKTREEVKKDERSFKILNW